MDERETDNESNWQFNDSTEKNQLEDPSGASETSAAPDEPSGNQSGGQPNEKQIEWTASEFIARHKPYWWHLALIAVTAAISAIIYFTGHDYVAIAAVIIIAIIFDIIATRKPQSLNYRLDRKGLTIANKLYPYNQFKAFSIMREGAFTSLNLSPLKRFMPILTVYYDPDDEESITDIIGDYLPLENRQPDTIDKLLHKIHF